MTVGESRERVESETDSDDQELETTPTPSDAFGALGGETRMTVVQALADDEPRTFSELHDATDADTSAGFAYHLRQLTDQFVRQRADERYELTDAGRAVARAVRAGTYTASVDREPVALDEDCPFCGDAALRATVADNVTEIGCDTCDRPVLRMSFPPSGYADRDADAVPEALDAHHRRRIGSFADGVCPECAGPVATTVEAVGAGDARDGSDGTERGDAPEPVQLAFACETCGADLKCPAALAVLDHPAVAAFYHDHDRDVRDRPIWNVGAEWRERVVSRDPWCVLVSVRLDDEDLLLYVAGDGSVVDHRRVPVDDPGTERTAEESGSDAESASA